MVKIKVSSDWPSGKSGFYIKKFEAKHVDSGLPGANQNPAQNWVGL
jgi:hypothetical protein